MYVCVCVCVCPVQVLRSLSEWSGGVPLENSIMNAWIQAIEKAEHFIYIEVSAYVHTCKLCNYFSHVYCFCGFMILYIINLLLRNEHVHSYIK